MIYEDIWMELKQVDLHILSLKNELRQLRKDKQIWSQTIEHKLNMLSSLTDKKNDLLERLTY